MKLKEVLIQGKNSLKNNNIDDYDIISKILMEYLIGIDKNILVAHYDDEIEDYKCKEYSSMIEKVSNGMPVQYITNNQEFMKLKFYVDENVLIPQPDTELLVEEVLSNYKEECKILDMCTGSGAIGISIAKYINNAHIYASDISTRAIQIAKLNAEKNLVHKQMEFVISNMFENIKETDFDAIVSNPPYIKTDVIKGLDKQVNKEPHIALDGGEDGLNFYRIIAENSYKYLKNDGKLFLEIGYDQKDDVMKILESTGMYKDIYSKNDLGGNDRIVVSTVRR